MQLEDEDQAELDRLEAEAAEAAAKASAIQAAIIDGATELTAAELIDAEAERDRRRGAVDVMRRLIAQRAERKAEKERQERIAALEALIVERFGEGDGQIVVAFEKARAALEEMAALVADRNAGLRSIYDDLIALGELPAGLRVEAASGSVRLDRKDVTVEPLSAERLACDAAYRALLAVEQPAQKVRAIAGTGPAYDDAQIGAYGVERGAVLGPIDQVVRVARIVAAR